MADLKVKYELVQSHSEGKLELIQLGEKIADLETDQQTDDPKTFKNKNAYQVITMDDYFKVRVLADSNNAIYRWTLKISLVDENGNLKKNLTPTPIAVDVNAAGRADYDKPIRWRDPA
jgi:hypothetical protein